MRTMYVSFYQIVSSKDVNSVFFIYL